jgi:DNA-binding response OmpR family regulator
MWTSHNIMNDAQDIGTRKPRILIVEDETPVAMMMVHLLSQAGCDVMVAHTGEKGMQLAQENKFDLIILDVDLSGMNGFEVCSELKQRHQSRRIPIVLIAKKPCEKDRQQGLEVGAVDYITKPFDAPNFVRRLLSHIKPASVMA